MIVVKHIAGLATIQDLGRPGRMHEALPRGGALVPELLAIANRAVGNADDLPAIELFGRMRIRAQVNLLVGTRQRIALRAGAELVVESGTLRVGYLALAGGIDAPLVLGGRGAHLSAGIGAPLRAGAQLVARDRRMTGDATDRDALDEAARDRRTDDATDRGELDDDLARARRTDDATDRGELDDDLAARARRTDDATGRGELDDDLAARARRTDDATDRGELDDDLAARARRTDDATDRGELDDDLAARARRTDDATDRGELDDDLAARARRTDDATERDELDDDLARDRRMTGDPADRGSFTDDELAEPAALLALDDDSPIRVIAGPDRVAGALETLFAGDYRISPASDRVGTRLVGPALGTVDGTAVSRPMVRGAIEVPPDGAPIVLGPEHPTTGGYPVIAVVATADLGRLFARPIGARVRFTAVAAR